MKVNEIMSKNVHYISSETTLKQAAEVMRDMDCGFLPVGENPNGKLLGVVTDRDIAVRAIADGKDPMHTPVRDSLTRKVVYCFQDDDLVSAAQNMARKKIYRLIVLTNKNEKRLCGVITLGDIVRHDHEDLVAQAVCNIAA